MTEFIAVLSELNLLPVFAVAMGCIGAMVLLIINWTVMIIKDINRC